MEILDLEDNSPDHLLHNALNVWNEEFLAQYYKYKHQINKDQVYRHGQCCCGAPHLVEITETLSGKWTRDEMKKLLEWGIIEDDDISVLAKMMDFSGCDGKSDMEDIIWLMKQMDKKKLIEWRCEYGHSILHYFYGGYDFLSMYGNSVVRYVIGECGMDPNTEFYDPTSTENGSKEMQPDILSLAIRNDDLSTVHYLLEMGADPKRMYQVTYQNVYDKEVNPFKGMDELMVHAYRMSHTYHQKKLEKMEADLQMYKEKDWDVERQQKDIQEHKEIPFHTYHHLNVYQFWTMLRFCIKYGDDVTRKDAAGRTIRDLLVDMRITKSDNTCDDIVKWFDDFIE